MLYIMNKVLMIEGMLLYFNMGLSWSNLAEQGLPGVGSAPVDSWVAVWARSSLSLSFDAVTGLSAAGQAAATGGTAPAGPSASCPSRSETSESPCLSGLARTPKTFYVRVKGDTDVVFKFNVNVVVITIDIKFKHYIQLLHILFKDHCSEGHQVFNQYETKGYFRYRGD